MDSRYEMNIFDMDTGHVVNHHQTEPIYEQPMNRTLKTLGERNYPKLELGAAFVIQGINMELWTDR